MDDDRMVEIDLAKNKKAIILFLLCLLLIGFILGFAISGRMVQSNWERFYGGIQKYYEDNCVCRKKIPYGLQEPTEDWKNQAWATMDIKIEES